MCEPIYELTHQNKERMNVVERIREQNKANIMQQLVAKPHRRRIVNLDDVRSIGLIARCLSDADQVTLSQFTHHMTNRGCMVRKIELPPNAEELLDKYRLPKPEFTRLFTSYHYDVLIDTTTGSNPFGPFITLNASSNLRVGYGGTPPAPQSPTTPGTNSDSDPKSYQDIYDLIILGTEPFTLSRYLTNILEYLIQIRKI